MDTKMLIEIFGYIGSTLVVVSMLMSSVIKLRVVNTAGSIISGAYALIIGSFPLALMNFSLIIINLYNLNKLLRSEKQYDFVEGNKGDTVLGYFLNHYQEDIRLHFPGFEMGPSWDGKAYFVFCDGTPAGVLLGTQKSTGVIDVMIDYSIPAYRDCSVGKYLYAKLPGKGVHKLVFSQKESDTHASYMARMGFAKENGVYTKILD